MHFSDCILNDRAPEPSGDEGLADVRVIRALYKSARTRPAGAPRIETPDREAVAAPREDIPAVRVPRMVHATPPSG
jgi:glucose-fructose oxidoreductase